MRFGNEKILRFFLLLEEILVKIRQALEPFLSPWPCDKEEILKT
jgi:hypothetical protein